MIHASLRRTQVIAWKGSSLLVLSERGECDENDPLAGFYYREARYLRRLSFRLNQQPAWLCHVTQQAADRLTFDYAFPELTSFGGGGSGAGDDGATDAAGIPHRALDLRLSIGLGIAVLRLDLAITNRANAGVELEVVWHVSADFADLQEALGEQREQRGETQSEAAANGLLFAYQHPELPYRTKLSVRGPAGWRIGPNQLATRVQLPHQHPVHLSLHVRAEDFRELLQPAEIERRERRWRGWADRRSCFTIPENSVAQAILTQQADDFASFALLEGQGDEWLAQQAGVPLYPALFGRDAITAGWQATLLDRGDSLDETLTRLGRLQGRQPDPWRDEQPGRILQQVRGGPVARLGRTPFDRYYGDFSSPLMFVIGLAHLYAWTGERPVLARHWDVARRIMDWARTDGDPDQDGFLEYHTRSPQGAKHQGWRDSGEGVLYEDGRPVATPIGTCELQGYWYSAQQLMAVLSWVMGARDETRDFWRSAADLKRRFNRDWWVEDDQALALALDRDKRLIHAPSSNMGQCLATGIVSREHMPALVGRLFAPDLFSGWGIRTLSTAHHSYNPIGYHLGSVWPVQNATIVFGLRRFGFNARALDLTRGLFDLAALYADHRVPECVGGYARGDCATPGAYPRANVAQLWNTSGYIMLMQSILGLQPVAPLDLLIADPVLPAWLPEVILHDLRVGGATATLRFWRDARAKSHVEILQKRGTLHLLQQPPPESVTAKPTDRVRALIDRVVYF